MKVKFTGRIISKDYGCSSCGGRRRVEGKFESKVRLFLPNSSQPKTFFVGEVYEVVHHDGLFLLNQTYHRKGQEVAMFEEVKDGN